jgi:MbtH protein
VSETTETAEEHLVVVNHEQQYSIWRADREVPAGWEATGFRGPKDACLAHVAEVWTDMRPLSVRLRDEERTAAEAVR